MNVLEALVHWAGFGEPPLDELLRKIGEVSPDLKPAADAWLAALQTDVTPDGLAAVALALPGEGLNILKLKLEPEDHPGDHI